MAERKALFLYGAGLAGSILAATAAFIELNKDTSYSGSNHSLSNLKDPYSRQITDEEINQTTLNQQLLTEAIPQVRIREVIRPALINIPDINFIESIQEVEDKADPNNNGIVTYDVPQKGIATPKNQDILKGNIYIFGHSESEGEKREFRKIADLNKGSLIYIADQRKRIIKFEVATFKLLNLDEDLVPLEPEAALILQATATFENEQIMDRNKLNSKVENPHVVGKNIVLLVIAKRLP